MRKFFSILFLIIACKISFTQEDKKKHLSTNKNTFFIENKGQIINQDGTPNSAVRYLLNTPGLNVQLRNTGFSYDFYEIEKIKTNRASNRNSAYKRLPYELDTTAIKKNYHRIDFDFMNISPLLKIKTFEVSKSYLNYSHLPFSSEDITNVHSFRKIVYENIYQHINLEFYVPNDKNKPIEYNFIILPGGDIHDIQIKISGVTIDVAEDKICMDSEFGEINEIIPQSWLQDKLGRKDLQVSYKLIGNNTVGFSINQKIKSNTTITIDPTPVRLWGTYFGGENAEAYFSLDMAVDDNNNVYGCGATKSATNIATSGAYQTTYTNNPNYYTAFLYKLTSDGQMEWSTYYGVDTHFRGIAIDQNGDIIVVGLTYDLNIATSGVHQTSLYNGGTDGVIIKFSPSGLPIWGTYYGGERLDICYKVAVDSNNNICVVGETASQMNIASTGAYKETGLWNEPWFTAAYPLALDTLQTFLLKLDNLGTRIWCTYYAGYGPKDIALDNNDDIYIVGTVNFLNEDTATPGAFLDFDNPDADPTTQNSPIGFLAKFNSSGSRIWGTHIGDPYTITSDYCNGVAVDNLGNPIICGLASTTQLPTINAYQPEKGSVIPLDAYLIKFNNIGDVIFSTYYGGTGSDYAMDVEVDEFDNIYFGGITNSNESIATEDAFLPIVNNYLNSYSDDAMLVKFNSCGQRIWGTYYGGTQFESIHRIKYKNGNIHILGLTKGSTNLGTAGAYQTTYGGGEYDNFLAKFNENEQIANSLESVLACEGGNIELNAGEGDTFSWTGPNNFISNQQSITISDSDQNDAGTYTVFVQDTDGCPILRKFEVSVMDTSVIGEVENLEACEDLIDSGISSSFDTSNIETQLLNGQTNMVVSYFNEDGNELPSPLPNPMTNTVTEIQTITARVANANNPDCFIETNFNLVVIPLPTPIASFSVYACDEDNDGFASFDLSNIEDTVLTDSVNFEIVFLDSNHNLIDDTTLSNYNNLVIDEIITIRIINIETQCYSETLVTLITKPAPIANTMSDVIGCDGDGDGSAVFSLTEIKEGVLGTQTGLEVSYYDDSGNPFPTPIPTPFTNTVPFFQTIIVRVTDPDTGCYAETLVNLNVSIKPDINKPQDLYACDKGNGIGVFDTSELQTEIIGTQTGVSVSYFDEDGNELPSPLPTSFSNTIPYNQTIYVKVENNQHPQCSSQTYFNLVVHNRPDINLQNEYEICELEPFLYLSVMAGYDSYEWLYEDGSVVSTNYNATLTEAGSYTLTVGNTKNGFTCYSSFEFNLIRNSALSITEVNYSELGNNQIEIITNGGYDPEYSIDGIHYTSSNWFTGLTGGFYTVYVRDRQGCGEDSQEVVLLDYPRYFTPNGDGVNDYWQIFGISNFPRSTTYIFDRYGKLLINLPAESRGWDGFYNNTLMPSSDYWFQVILDNGFIFKGHFTLKR